MRGTVVTMKMSHVTNSAQRMRSWRARMKEAGFIHMNVVISKRAKQKIDTARKRHGLTASQWIEEIASHELAAQTRRPDSPHASHWPVDLRDRDEQRAVIDFGLEHARATAEALLAEYHRIKRLDPRDIPRLTDARRRSDVAHWFVDLLESIDADRRQREHLFSNQGAASDTGRLQEASRS